MIELTRLNGNPLYVNGDQIKWAESAPDTMLTLMNGEKVLVRESCPEVVDRMIAFRVRLLRAAAEMVPGGLAAEWTGALAGGALRAAPPGAAARPPGGADSAQVLD